MKAKVKSGHGKMQGQAAGFCGKRGQGISGMVGLKGKRVLVVEDETLISMLFEDILSDLNCEVVGPALNIRQATDLALTAEIDVAVLDVNLAGDPIYPVAEILVGRGVPLVFSSGYGSTSLPERWQNQATLPKPFTSGQVEDVLQKLVGL